ncbi:MAG: SDR family NAD(P)-dependent oxidoreductase [Polyangiales bacterium]
MSTLRPLATQTDNSRRSQRVERVLVTGASRGIGRAVCEQLLARDIQVAAVSRNEQLLKRLCELRPALAHPLVADLAAPCDYAALVRQASAALGGLDALVNCAGVVHYESLQDASTDHIQQQVQLNLLAPLYLSREVASVLQEQGRGGALVQVASTLAFRSAPNTGVYAACKAALVSLTRSLALELAPSQIRVNAVAPGLVDTDMIRVVRDAPAGQAAGREAALEAQLEDLRRLHPLGRLGRPQDVATTIMHLLDAAWTTGSVFVVDGGLLAG